MKTIYRLLFLLAIAAHLPAAQSFAGTWIHQEDGSTTIATISVSDQGHLSATVVEDGYPYRLTGSVQGNQASINLLIEGEVIPGSLSVTGDSLLAVVEGERYLFTRRKQAPGPGQVQPPTVGQQGQQGQQGPYQQPPRGAGTQVPAGQPQQVVLKRHVLRDPGVRNMESHTLLAPQGWQVQGGAFWPAPAFFKVLPSQEIRVTAPNGPELIIAPDIAAFDYWPSAQARQLGSTRPTQGASNNGYPVIHLPADEAGWRQMMRQGIQQNVEGAKDITIQEIIVVPELTALLQQRLAPVKAQQQAGGFCEGAVFAASSRYTVNGATWEQLNVFGLTNIGFDSEFGRNNYWGVEANLCFRAPQGLLESHLPLLTAIANSLGHTQAWVAMVNNHARKINQAASFQPNIIQDAGKSVSDIMFEGWQNREKITSTSQRRVVESIHGVTTYQHGESQVQLPTGYNNVYTNGLGEYILSNDHFYQPNTDPAINSQNWETMQTAP